MCYFLRGVTKYIFRGTIAVEFLFSQLIYTHKATRSEKNLKRKSVTGHYWLINFHIYERMRGEYMERDYQWCVNISKKKHFNKCAIYILYVHFTVNEHNSPYERGLTMSSPLML